MTIRRRFPGLPQAACKPLRARVPMTAAVIACLGALTGCSVSAAQPAATAPAVAPATTQQFVCPPSAAVAGLTALPFARSTDGPACTYDADDAGRAASILIRHPAATGTLIAARSAQSRGATITAATGLGFDAFTVRAPNGTCTAWVYAADGMVTSVAARHSGWSATRACLLTRSAVTLLGTAPVPVVSAITASTLTSSRGSGAQWTDRVARALGLRVRALPAAGSGYVTARPTASKSFADQAKRVDPASTAVVFVSGTADAGAPRLALLQAATTALSAARSTAPRARLIVVGPVQAGPQPSASVLTLRDDLRRAATIAGATFIDPIAADWATDSAATTTDRVAAAVQRALRTGPLCPGYPAGSKIVSTCDAATQTPGARRAVLAPDWTQATP